MDWAYAIERHRANRELQLQAARLLTSEARSRALIEASLDAVFVVDADTMPLPVCLEFPAGDHLLEPPVDVLIDGRWTKTVQACVGMPNGHRTPPSSVCNCCNNCNYRLRQSYHTDRK